MSITKRQSKPRKARNGTRVPGTTAKWRAALIDLLPGLIAITTPARVILFWGKGAEAATGWSAAEAVGKDFVQLLGVSDRNDMDDAFGQLADGSGWEGEFEIVTRTNSTRTFHGRWKRMDDGDAWDGSLLLVNSDITNLKRTRLESLRASLPDSVGPLASGIAHDLNNVLAPIMIGADVLEPTCQGAEQRDMVQMIRSSARRGAQLVQQILLLT